MNFPTDQPLIGLYLDMAGYCLVEGCVETRMLSRVLTSALRSAQILRNPLDPEFEAGLFGDAINHFDSFGRIIVDGFDEHLLTIFPVTDLSEGLRTVKRELRAIGLLNRACLASFNYDDEGWHTDLCFRADGSFQACLNIQSLYNIETPKDRKVRAIDWLRERIHVELLALNKLTGGEAEAGEDGAPQ